MYFLHAVDYQAEDYAIRNHDSEFLEDPDHRFHDVTLQLLSTVLHKIQCQALSPFWLVFSG